MVDRLLVYALGALHAAALLLAVVVLLLATGGTRALAGVGTAPGIGLGLWLALLSWGATAWALHGQAIGRERWRDALGRAGLAGFVAGALFVVGVLLGFGLAAGEIVPATLVFAAFASPFAGAFGALVAMLLALVDFAVYLGLGGAGWLGARGEAGA